MQEAQAIYCPCFLGILGSLSGLIYTACVPMKGYIPVVIGGTVGGGIGCLYCLGYFAAEWVHPELAHTRDAERIIIQNRYAEEIGEGRD